MNRTRGAPGHEGDVVAGTAARAGLGAVTAALLAVGVFTACSSTLSEAEQFCGQLDGGAVPVQAVGSLPGAEADPMAVLSRARDHIRSTCPQYEAAAASFDTYLAGGVSETDAAPPAPPRTIELRVEGTVSAAQVTFGVGGTNGGGDTVKLPWTRTGTLTGQEIATLSAVTPTGTTGAVSCSITDTATGEVLSRQVRNSGGGSTGYASVICSAGELAGPTSVDPPLTPAAAKPTTKPTTKPPARPATSPARPTRPVRTESKAVTDSRAVGGGLAACIDQTGMTEAQCRAASAAGLGG